jgi:hypothetical protein
VLSNPKTAFIFASNLITMRRLLSLIKKIAPLTSEQQEVFSAKLRKKVLLPRERLGEDIPLQSWIFIEEGFLLLFRREKKRWSCKNFYYEGVSTTIYNVGASELAEKSFNIQAVEKSVIYYLTPEDEEEIESVIPDFHYVSMILNMRSYRQHCKRASLFSLHHELDRIIYVTQYFTILFRAPEKHLAEFLCVKGKLGRMILASEYRKVRSVKNVND